MNHNTSISFVENQTIYVAKSLIWVLQDKSQREMPKGARAPLAECNFSATGVRISSEILSICLVPKLGSHIKALGPSSFREDDF